MYKSPESDEEVAIWENGYQTWIVCTYEDERGIVWGIPSSEREEKIGWVPMEYMKFVYDSTSFTENHSSQIERRDGRLDYESYKNDIIYLWKYPGSDNGISVNMQDLLDVFSNLDNYLDYIIPEYSFVYTDEEGRSWGYVGDYFKLYEDRWICLDNPTAEFEELYPNGAPQYGVEDDEEIKEGKTQSGENQAAEKLNTEWIKPQTNLRTNQRTIVVVIVLVTAVVLVTILLLVRLRRRK